MRRQGELAPAAVAPRPRVTGAWLGCAVVVLVVVVVLRLAYTAWVLTQLERFCVNGPAGTEVRSPLLDSWLADNDGVEQLLSATENLAEVTADRTGVPAMAMRALAGRPDRLASWRARLCDETLPAVAGGGLRLAPVASGSVLPGAGSWYLARASAVRQLGPWLGLLAWEALERGDQAEALRIVWAQLWLGEGLTDRRLPALSIVARAVGYRVLVEAGTTLLAMAPALALEAWEARILDRRLADLETRVVSAQEACAAERDAIASLPLLLAAFDADPRLRQQTGYQEPLQPLRFALGSTGQVRAGLDPVWRLMAQPLGEPHWAARVTAWDRSDNDLRQLHGEQIPVRVVLRGLWSPGGAVRGWLAAYGLPDLHRVELQWRRAVLWLRAMRVALALVAWRTEVGGWPSDLAALAAWYRLPLPEDPFGDAPFRCGRGAPPVFYSVGADGSDSGGRSGPFNESGRDIWLWPPWPADDTSRGG